MRNKKILIFTLISLVLANVILVTSLDIIEGFANIKEENIELGDPPTIISGEPIATEKAGDFLMKGGKVELDFHYSGKIEFKGEATLISGEWKLSIKKGIIEVKNGEIINIKNAEALEIESPEFKWIKISGKNINYNANKKIISSDKLIKIARDKSFKEISSENGKDFYIKEKFGPWSPIIDSNGETIKISDEKGNFGKLNGIFSFDELTEFGSGFQLTPSGEKDIAKFELERAGIKGDITKNTYLNHLSSETLADKSTIYRSKDYGLVSTIGYDGELHLSAQDNNKINLNFDDEKFDYVYQSMIQDDSEVTISTNDDDKKEILFSKYKPLARGDLSKLKSLIGTSFEVEDEKIWSWELKKGSSVPEIYQRNILYLTSPELSLKDRGGMFMGLGSFIDPKTGEYIKGKIPLEKVLRKQLAEPLLLETKTGERSIFYEGEKPHSYNVEYKEIKDAETFFNALKTKLPNGVKWDKLIISSHGKPTYLDLDSPVTIDDLKKLPKEDLDSISKGFSRTSVCITNSCLLFANYEKPEYKDKIFAEHLAKTFGFTVIGSAPEVIVNPSASGEYLGLKSTKWLVAYPTKEGVKISDKLPNFKLMLITLNYLFFNKFNKIFSSSEI